MALLYISPVDVDFQPRQRVVVEVNRDWSLATVLAHINQVIEMELERIAKRKIIPDGVREKWGFPLLRIETEGQILRFNYGIQNRHKM